MISKNVHTLEPTTKSPTHDELAEHIEVGKKTPKAKPGRPKKVIKWEYKMIHCNEESKEIGLLNNGS